MPNILSILTFLPLLAAAAVVFFPKSQTKAIKYFTTGFFFVEFLLTLPLWFGWDAAQAVADHAGRMWVFEEGPRVWISSLGVSYHLGVDGVSLLLVVLTNFLGSWPRGRGGSISRAGRRSTTSGCSSSRRACWGSSSASTSSSSTCSGK